MTRIIAGRCKGRRLRTPAQDTTRPTTDRVREAVFSAIVDWAGTSGEPSDEQLRDLTVIDLYAGSGAIALESASRGAEATYAVESQAKVAAIAKENAAVLGLSTRVITAAVEPWLSGTRSIQADVVWADPPYALSLDECERMLTLVVDREWLKPDGLLILERSSRDEVPQFPTVLTQRWSRRYGETLLYFAMKG